MCVCVCVCVCVRACVCVYVCACMCMPFTNQNITFSGRSSPIDFNRGGAHTPSTNISMQTNILNLTINKYSVYMYILYLVIQCTKYYIIICI